MKRNNLLYLTLSLVLAAASPSKAAEKTISEYLADAWNYTYYTPFMNNLSELPNTNSSVASDQAACNNFYSKVTAKREMKIIMGIGYYDFSEGEPFVFNYRPDGQTAIETYNFGMNATIDITYEIMYRKILTAPCRGNLQLCGFNEEETGVYVKNVRAPNGESVRAVVQIKNASVSPSHANNIGALKAQQDSKSAETTQWFFDSIQNSDLVVYNGHSRKGGGPDFNPPKLFSNLHVDYGWYAKNTPGLNRLLNALKAPTQPEALMLMSCNSEKLFHAKIAKVAANTALASTNAIIPGNIPNQGAIAGMDSFLRFQCQDGFAQEMHSNSDLKAQLHLPVIK